MNLAPVSKEFLRSAKCIFWDFDGVIKDSVGVKAEAFKTIFDTCNDHVLKEIIRHHTENSGISRFNKIPIYLFDTN